VLCCAQFQEKLEFMAPLWSVMSGAEVPLDEVRRGIAFAALTVRRQDRPEDFRRHEFRTNHLDAKLIFLRAHTQGAVSSVNDSKTGPYPMGPAWYAMCDDVQVIEIPGDHFSILRQDDEDIHYVVTALKMALGQGGWTEVVPLRGSDEALNEDEEEEEEGEVNDFDAQLRDMGVKDPELRAHLQTTMQPVTETMVDRALAAAERATAVVPINSAARLGVFTNLGRPRSPQPEYSDEEEDEVLRDFAREVQVRNSIPKCYDPPSDLPAIILCCDANGGVSGMEPMLSLIQLPVFAVTLPLDDCLWDATTAEDLAEMAVKAARATVWRRRPRTRLVPAGVGFGGVVAFEMAVQMHRDTGLAQPLCLFDGVGTIKDHLESFFWAREGATLQELDELAHTAALLHPTLADARTRGKAVVTLESLAAMLDGLPTFEAQLEWMSRHKPPSESQATWDRRVHALLLRLAYFRNMVDTYTPNRHLPGECLLFGDHEEDRMGGTLEEGGRARVWWSIRSATMPPQRHNLPGDACFDRTADWVGAGLVEAATEAAVEENWIPGAAPPPQPGMWTPAPRPDWRPENKDGE